MRKRLPKSRRSVTTSFTVGGAEGYMTAGSYPDDGLGEVFLKLGKQGSTLAGVMDAFSMAISISLQYGVPLETYVQKFTNMKFEPAGLTDDPDIRMSAVDHGLHLPPAGAGPPAFERRASLGIHSAEERRRQLETGSYAPVSAESEEELEEEIESLSQGIGASSKKSDAVAPAEAKASPPAAAGRARALRLGGPLRRRCSFGS